MSIKFIDEFIFDIYVKKYLIKNINFDKKEELQKYLKHLFKLLNNKYDIKMEGFYNVVIYIDNFYGIIVHVEKENITYYDYYKNEVDMRIIVKNINFKYKIDDIPFNLKDKIKIESDKNNIYLIILKELSKIEMMNLMESSVLIYK